jgi:hypothetical protein
MWKSFNFYALRVDQRLISGDQRVISGVISG